MAEKWVPAPFLPSLPEPIAPKRKGENAKGLCWADLQLTLEMHGKYYYGEKPHLGSKAVLSYRKHGEDPIDVPSLLFIGF